MAGTSLQTCPSCRREVDGSTARCPVCGAAIHAAPHGSAWSPRRFEEKRRRRDLSIAAQHALAEGHSDDEVVHILRREREAGAEEARQAIIDARQSTRQALATERHDRLTKVAVVGPAVTIALGIVGLAAYFIPVAVAVIVILVALQDLINRRV